MVSDCIDFHSSNYFYCSICISTEDICCTFFLWSSFTLQCNQTNNLLTFFHKKKSFKLRINGR